MSKKAAVVCGALTVTRLEDRVLPIVGPVVGQDPQPPPAIVAGVGGYEGVVRISGAGTGTGSLIHVATGDQGASHHILTAAHVAAGLGAL